jgi:L-ascorbate metabolism protein UlaG (beta-lactamase superfamily)
MEFKFLDWIEHAGFRLKLNGKTVYLDPFRLSTVKDRADSILITHPHLDHFSIEDIKKVADEKTEIFVPKDSVSKLEGFNAIGVEPNKEYTTNGIRFRTVPAYNVVENRIHNHPKASGWVGYIIDANGIRVYHAGDTDFIDEMHSIEADLALLPIGGSTYVMTVEEAIEASKAIKAKQYSPIHYRALLGREGSKKAEELFTRMVKNGVVLEQIQEPRYSFQ